MQTGLEGGRGPSSPKIFGKIPMSKDFGKILPPKFFGKLFISTQILRNLFNIKKIPMIEEF